MSEFVIFSLSPLRSWFIRLLASFDADVSNKGFETAPLTTPKRLFYLTGSQAQMLSFLQTFKKEPGSVHCPFSPKNFTALSIFDLTIFCQCNFNTFERSWAQALRS